MGSSDARGYRRWRGTMTVAGSASAATGLRLPSRCANSLAERAECRGPRRLAYQIVPPAHASAPSRSRLRSTPRSGLETGCSCSRTRFGQPEPEIRSEARAGPTRPACSIKWRIQLSMARPRSTCFAAPTARCTRLDRRRRAAPGWPPGRRGEPLHRRPLPVGLAWAQEMPVRGAARRGRP